MELAFFTQVLISPRNKRTKKGIGEKMNDKHLKS